MQPHHSLGDGQHHGRLRPVGEGKFKGFRQQQRPLTPGRDVAPGNDLDAVPGVGGQGDIAAQDGMEPLMVKQDGEARQVHQAGAELLRHLMQEPVDGGLPAQEMPQVVQDGRVGAGFKDNNRPMADQAQPGACCVVIVIHDAPRARVGRRCPPHRVALSLAGCPRWRGGLPPPC